MTSDYDNRMAVVRTRGRPRGSSAGGSFEAIEAVLPGNAVPAAVECKGCGRRVEPRVISRKPDGTANCQCGFCGTRFDYRPPAIRWLDAAADAGPIAERG